MANLVYKVERGDGRLLVSISGSLDASNAAELTSEIEKSLAADPAVKNIVWEASGLTLMASAGLRVAMISIKGAMGRGGKFFLVKPNPNIAGLIRMAGMNQFLTIRDSVEECV